MAAERVHKTVNGSTSESHTALLGWPSPEPLICKSVCALWGVEGGFAAARALKRRCCHGRRTSAGRCQQSDAPLCHSASVVCSCPPFNSETPRRCAGAFSSRRAAPALDSLQLSFYSLLIKALLMEICPWRFFLRMYVTSLASPSYSRAGT